LDVVVGCRFNGGNLELHFVATAFGARVSNSISLGNVDDQHEIWPLQHSEWATLADAGSFMFHKTP